MSVKYFKHDLLTPEKVPVEFRDIQIGWIISVESDNRAWNGRAFIVTDTKLRVENGEVTEVLDAFEMVRPDDSIRCMAKGRS